MATVDRVLPWRRHRTRSRRGARAAARPRTGRRHPKAPVALDQPRLRGRRGRPRTASSGASPASRYINHPLARGRIVADLGLDDITIAAALLHDAVEDTAVTLDDVEREFGAEVAAIVDGVTKLDRLQFDSKEAQQAATMRKMLVAMAKDLRVLLIKLADRLHNMRTIAALPEREAGAHRPGDARHLRAAGPPPRHAGDEVAARGPRVRVAAPEALRRDRPDGVARARPSASVYLDAGARARCAARLAELQHRRPRSPAGRSTLEHLREDGRARARSSTRSSTSSASGSIVESVKDCYAALGSIHAHVEAGAGPVQGLHRDAQVQPLPVVAHDGGRARRASRSRCRSAPREMHQRAECGVAAHWGYKERRTRPTTSPGCNRIVDWQQETTDPAEFMESLKIDLEQDEVFVFTPKGQVDHAARRGHAGRLRLRDPHRGRPPLHRRPGQRPAGAARLHARSRATPCEIFTSQGRGRGPVAATGCSSSQTPRARNKIRQWFSP